MPALPQHSTSTAAHLRGTSQRNLIRSGGRFLGSINIAMLDTLGMRTGATTRGNRSSCASQLGPEAAHGTFDTEGLECVHLNLSTLRAQHPRRGKTPRMNQVSVLAPTRIFIRDILKFGGNGDGVCSLRKMADRVQSIHLNLECFRTSSGLFSHPCDTLIWIAFAPTRDSVGRWLFRSRPFKTVLLREASGP